MTISVMELDQEFELAIGRLVAVVNVADFETRMALMRLLPQEPCLCCSTPCTTEHPVN